MCVCVCVCVCVYSSLCLFCSIRTVTGVRNQDLLHSLPISLTQFQYCFLYQQQLMFAFFLLFNSCWLLFLTRPSFQFSGHELYFLLPVVQNCTFAFHLDQRAQLQFQLQSLEHFQILLQNIHDIIWPFPFHRSLTS